jgi:hypothetical protein
VLTLGLPTGLQRFFATTNCVENLIGTVRYGWTAGNYYKVEEELRMRGAGTSAKAGATSGGDGHLNDHSPRDARLSADLDLRA